MALVVMLGASAASAQDQGETLFNQSCVACHTIGAGRLVGPNLANVRNRRNEEWIISFIRSSQSLIASGDADAVATFEEYNRFPMPDHAYSDDDIRAIMGYIARNSPADGSTPSNEPMVVEAVDDGNIQIGEDLFVGKIRFENRAAACNTCHTTDTGSVMTGGSLAINLTDAVFRLTRPGVDAMMANPPFPIMRSAFQGRRLTDMERIAIADYLQTVSDGRADLVPRDYQATLLIGALVGILLLLGVFFLLGLRSTKRSVNHKIYERQISTA